MLLLIHAFRFFGPHVSMSKACDLNRVSGITDLFPFHARRLFSFAFRSELLSWDFTALFLLAVHCVFCHPSWCIAHIQSVGRKGQVLDVENISSATANHLNHKKKSFGDTYRRHAISGDECPGKRDFTLTTKLNMFWIRRSYKYTFFYIINSIILGVN